MTKTFKKNVRARDLGALATLGRAVSPAVARGVAAARVDLAGGVARLAAGGAARAVAVVAVGLGGAGGARGDRGAV